MQYTVAACTACTAPNLTSQAALRLQQPSARHKQPSLYSSPPSPCAVHDARRAALRLQQPPEHVTSSPPFTAARRARARSTTLGEPLPAGSRYNRPAHNQEMWMGAQQPHGVDAPRRRLRLRPALSPPPPASPRSLRPAWRASACTARPRGAAPPLSSS